MRKKLLTIVLLTTVASVVSTFADPISTPNSVSDTPIIGIGSGNTNTNTNINTNTNTNTNTNANTNTIVDNVSGISISGAIDLTNATSDYKLKPGETAVVKFTNATTVPVHIAVENGLYWLYSNAGGCELYPSLVSKYPKSYPDLPAGTNVSPAGSMYGSEMRISVDSNGKLNADDYDYTMGIGDSSPIFNKIIYTTGFCLGDPTASGFIVSEIDTHAQKAFTYHASVVNSSASPDSSSSNSSYIAYGARFVNCHSRNGVFVWDDPPYYDWGSFGIIKFREPRSGIIVIKRIL